MSNDNRGKSSQHYYISVKELGLSDEASNALKRYGLKTIGDCLDLFDHMKSGNSMLFRGNFLQLFHTEVKQKLIERGYLPANEADT